MSKLFKLFNKLIPSKCRIIPAIDGGDLLLQVRLSKRFYLHKFLKPEPQDIFHVHRWHKMRSFILKGSYTEERLFIDGSSKIVKHNWLSTFSMDKSVIHRIESWDNCWSLFFFDGSDENWGYVDRSMNYTPWQEYIPEDKRVKHV